MKILNLYDDVADFSGCGGKAKGLNKMSRLGLNVPKGFVLCDLDENSLNDELEAIVEHYSKSGLKCVAVRSSATNEDGQEFSAAGQYKTFLNIDNETALRQAVEECVNSLQSETAKSYMANFHSDMKVKMNVVVQEMIMPSFSGVVFSKSPMDLSKTLIEVVEGLGETLVSGTKTAKQYTFNRKLNIAVADFNQYEETVLDKSVLEKLHNTALMLESELNCPQDLEFAIDKNKVIYWLQARPITIEDEANSLGEFDPTYNMDNMTLTRCNIGEMMPGAVTPLTISTSLYSIDYGMREMLRVSGVIKSRDDLPEYSCALSICNHLFINLTPLYKMDGTVVGAKSDMIEFSLCGRTLDTPKPKIKKSNFLKRLNNGRKYFSFLLSSKKARKELTKMAQTISIGENAQTPKELYNAIDANKWQNDKAMTLHYITSSHSGAMSSGLWQTLNSKFNDSEKSKTVVAELLEGIDNIESVDILRSLRTLARLILAKNKDAGALSLEELDSLLRTSQADIKDAHDYFMQTHGHRTIKEAEMRNKGWADERNAFLSYLKTVIQSGGNEPTKPVSPDIKQKIKDLGFKGFKAKILKYLANQARLGVINREFSKSKIIKLMDAFKKAYNRLAQMLFDEGVLKDLDLIFFLSHKEIGELVLNKNYGLIKKAIKRRRLLDEQSNLTFEEVNVSKPKPVILDVKSAISGTVLKGTSISRGSITALARVVKNESDAKALKKDEIMVAAYTDIGWSPYYCLISGLITEVGSALSHGAVVAREYSLPLIANVQNATHLIKTGDTITLDAYNGTIVIH